MLDTKVEGSPAAVTTAATWLRDTLAKKVANAGDKQQDARNDARGSWEGETASSYQNLTGDVLKASDKHEDRVKAAARALDDYAAKLKALEEDMSSIRSRASGGGLTVSGTVIHPPPEAPGGEFEVGSPEESAHKAAVAKIELWNTLVEDAAQDYETFVDWVDSTMPGAVAKAREKDGSDTVFETLEGLIPNFAGGSGAGLTGLALGRTADGLKAEAREFRRKSRVSGNPAVRGSADTPSGKAKLDDLLGKADWLGKGGRFLGGPAGILIDVGFGVAEGVETGNWERVALTTGTSIAVGLGATALVAAGVVTAPAWVTVVAAGAVAAGASWAVGQVYDNWDDITDSVGDAWDSATDTIGDAWDSVTPW
ncbi:hypothetical protein [Nocardioides renjunii]|uniref:hypothetical protein n=1 Tax=Nocardioides renjunii TaxID=3095075 RepID=UPI002AFF890A|nr:hypothetical protein [Nocardioides sp. S-34]WQQ23658.1 hypothetical protein SHK17_06635 [Nocardioides sp. S-34]